MVVAAGGVYRRVDHEEVGFIFGEGSGFIEHVSHVAVFLLGGDFVDSAGIGICYVSAAGECECADD